jgi:hypothetical protein
MKKIVILFLLFGSIKAQSLQQQINYLRMQVYELNRKVDSLQELNYLCCCENKMFVQRISNVFYWPENIDLNLNDRLPVMCNGSKAIMITADATVFCEYQDWNGGWIVLVATKSGYLINAE